jgi:hypothetical protein
VKEMVLPIAAFISIKQKTISRTLKPFNAINRQASIND